MEQGKVKKFFASLPNRLKEYFIKYFKGLNYPLWILFIVLAVGLFLFDYFTKCWAYPHLTELAQQGIKSETFIPGLIDFRLVGNKGAAWGSFSGAQWFLIPISMIATITLTINLLFRFDRYNWGMRVGMVLMLPGAAGNLIDRIGYMAQAGIYKDGVVDFLHFTFWDSFPVCNIADYCLTVGVVVMLIGFVFEFKKEYAQLKAEEEAEEAAKRAAEENHEDEDMAAKLSQLEEKQEENNENNGNENSEGDNSGQA